MLMHDTRQVSGHCPPPRFLDNGGNELCGMPQLDGTWQLVCWRHSSGPRCRPPRRAALPSDDADDDNGPHYHFHYHYHSPYVKYDDSSDTQRFSGAQQFAPGGQAGANRYYTPGYLNSSRTPSPSQSYIGDRDDEDGRTEILDQPGSDEANSNDEVGENVDQPDSEDYMPPPAIPNQPAKVVNFYASPQSTASQVAARAAPPHAAQGLPGDRGYLRVIVPMPDTHLIYDGHEIPGKGLLRSVMTARIAAGGSTAYSLVACWKDDSGTPRVSVHEAAIEAGEHQTVEFNVAPAQRP